MGKGASIQGTVKSFLVNLRMDGDMVNFFVLMSTGKGTCCVFGPVVCTFYYSCSSCSVYMVSTSNFQVKVIVSRLSL